MVSAAPAHSALVPLAAQEPVGEHSQRRLQFPAGCFVIQARTRGRKVWDIIGGGATGRVIGLHPFKEPVTRGTSLASPWNNQLFVLGWSGNLLPVCAEGKLVDCVGTSRTSLACPCQGYVGLIYSCGVRFHTVGSVSPGHRRGPDSRSPPAARVCLRPYHRHHPCCLLL